MSHTITLRLSKELAEWLAEISEKTGLPQGRIIREQLEKAKNSSSPTFMRLAGSVSGSKDLSSRKGFSKE